MYSVIQIIYSFNCFKQEMKAPDRRMSVSTGKQSSQQEIPFIDANRIQRLDTYTRNRFQQRRQTMQSSEMVIQENAQALNSIKSKPTQNHQNLPFLPQNIQNKNAPVDAAKLQEGIMNHQKRLSNASIGDVNPQTINFLTRPKQRRLSLFDPNSLPTSQNATPTSSTSLDPLQNQNLDKLKKDKFIEALQAKKNSKFSSKNNSSYQSREGSQQNLQLTQQDSSQTQKPQTDKFQMIIKSRVKNKEDERKFRYIQKFEEIQSKIETKIQSNYVQTQKQIDFKKKKENKKLEQEAAEAQKKVQEIEKKEDLAKQKIEDIKLNHKVSKLSHQFNDESLLTKFKRQVALKVADKMQEDIQKGNEQKKTLIIKAHKSPFYLLNKNANEMDSEEEEVAQKAPQANMEFFKFYEIKQMLSVKVIVAASNKIRDRKFVFKQIQSQSLDLVIAARRIQKSKRKCEDSNLLNKDYLVDYLSLISSWMNMTPQTPHQNLLNCYGIMMINERYYYICDLIQDDHNVPFQQANDRQGANQSEIIKMLQNLGTNPEEIRNNSSSEKIKVSANLYDFIYQMKLGNLSTLKQIPEFYVNCILKYIIHVTRAFMHAHKNDLVHGKFNLSKVVAQHKNQNYFLGIKSESPRKYSSSPEGLKLGVFGKEKRPSSPPKESQRSSAFRDIDDPNFEMMNMNFIVVNFEPWSVDVMMHKNQEATSIFHEALKLSQLKADRENYLQIFKILDLQAFGNSILEMMVGKFQESNKVDDQLQGDSINSNKNHQASFQQPFDNFKMQPVPNTAGENTHSKESFDSLKGFSGEQVRKMSTNQRPLPDNIKKDQSPKQGLKDSEQVSEKNMGAQELKENSQKLRQITGKVPLDSIPLNWGKHPLIQPILEMIKMCMDNQQDQDTTSIFEKIHLTACENYYKYFGSKDKDFDKRENFCPRNNILINQNDSKTSKQAQDAENRLNSSVQNNQGAVMFMMVTEDSPHERRNKVLRLCYKYFKRAIELSPDNTAAILNKALLQWYVGEVRDEEFQAILMEQIYPNDWVTAKLMYIMFKEKVQGIKVCARDKTKIVQTASDEYFSISNLGKYLLNGKDFKKQRDTVMSKSSAANLVKTFTQTFYQGDIAGNQNVDCKFNQLIDLNDEQLNPQSIFISNNDNFIGVIGEKSLIIIDTRTNKQIYNKTLPVVDADGLRHTYGTTSSEQVEDQAHSDARGVSMIEHSSYEQGSSGERRLSQKQKQSQGSSASGPKYKTSSNKIQIDASSISSRSKQNKKMNPTPYFAEEAKLPYNISPNRTRRQSMVGFDIESIPQSLKQSVGSAQGGSNKQGREGDRSHGNRINIVEQDLFSEGGEDIDGIGKGGIDHLDLSFSKGPSPAFQSNFVREVTPAGTHETKTRNDSHFPDPSSLFPSKDISNIRIGFTPQDRSPVNSSNLSSRFNSRIVKAKFIPSLNNTMNPQTNPGSLEHSVDQAQPSVQKNQNMKIMEHLSPQLKVISQQSIYKRQQTLHKQLTFNSSKKQLSKQKTRLQKERLQLPGPQMGQSGDRLFSDDFSQVSSDLSMMTSPEKSLNDIVEVNDKRSEISEGTLQEMTVEFKQLMEDYPPRWEADIRNNGKMLALFDKAQQDRNMHCKYELNRRETMYIQNIASQKTMSILHCMDMIKLLNNEEVLSFCFEDFNDSFSTICVQSKELYLYQIDFMKLEVLRKFESQRHNLVMKSIFQNVYKRFTGDKFMTIYQPLKEFIEHQKSLGNKLLIPKLNPQIIGIQLKGTDVIQIFNIKLMRVVREFTLSAGECEDHFQTPRESDGIKRKEDVKKMIEKKVRGKEEVVGKKRLGFLNAYKYQQNKHYNQIRLEKATEAVERQLESKQYKEELEQCDQDGCYHQCVRLLEISPSGKIMVCTFDSQKEIYIKVLRQETIEDHLSNNSIYSQAELSQFMPIYFDNDYTKLAEKPHKKNEEEKAQEQIKFMVDMTQSQKDSYHLDQQMLIGRGINSKPYSISSKGLTSIKASTFDKCQQLFNCVIEAKASLNQYQKNEKLLELIQVVNCVLEKPTLFTECQLKRKYQVQMHKTFFLIFKILMKLDTLNITLTDIHGYALYNSFKSLQFTRSFEYIKSFALTSGEFGHKQNMIAVFVNRSLHVYNFISNKLLFTVNTPNAGSYFLNQGLNQRMIYQKLLFLDNDSILAFQDGDRRIQFINIQAQTEAFSLTSHNKGTKDLTIKLDKPIYENYEVNPDFDIANAENENFEKNSDDSGDNITSGLVVSNFLEFNEDITQIYTSQNTSNLGYLAIVGKQRFTIYYVSDDNMGACECMKVIDRDYRFDKKLGCMGQIVCVDFERSTLSFVTGTSLGWVQIWDMRHKMLVRKFKLVDQSRPKMQFSCNILKTFNYDKKIVIFDAVSYSLILVEVIQGYHHPAQEAIEEKVQIVKAKQPKQSNKKVQIQQQMLSSISATAYLNATDYIKTTQHSTLFQNDLSPEDKQRLGTVIQIRMDRSQSFLVLLFQNNFLRVYNVKSFTNPAFAQEYGPFITDQIEIDDFCTFFSVLNKDKKSVQIYIFQWEYHIHQIIKKMTLKEQIGSNLIKQVDLKRNQILKVKQIENFEGALKTDVEQKIDEFVIQQKEKLDLERRNAKTCSIF